MARHAPRLTGPMGRRILPRRVSFPAITKVATIKWQQKALARQPPVHCRAWLSVYFSRFARGVMCFFSAPAFFLRVPL